MTPARATALGVALALTGLYGPIGALPSLDAVQPIEAAGQSPNAAGPVIELPLGPAADASPLWLAPSGAAGASANAMAAAVKQLAAGKAALAVPAFTKGLADPLTGGYARLLKARAELAAGRVDAARQTLAAFERAEPTGYLAEAVAMLQADVHETVRDWAAAARALDAAAGEPVNGAALSLRLARDRYKAGDADGAIAAYRRVLVQYALSNEAADAGAELAPLLTGVGAPPVETLSGDLARAETLFAAKRYADARKAFDAVRPQVTDVAADRVALRLAQCDVATKKFGAARAALQALAARTGGDAGVRAEARYALLGTLRGLELTDEYVAATRAFVSAEPASPWAEPALNDLATYYILEDQDADAARVFAEMYARYPAGPNAERAAWRSGWYAYTSGNFAETVRVFDDAFSRFGRSDYRSAWLYWAARARKQLGWREDAVAGLQRVVDLYRNSYYGREAARQLEALGVPAVARARRDGGMTVAPGVAPSNARLITRLLEFGLWDEAIGELKLVERAAGPAPVTTATLAYAWNRKGELRTAITLMRRAYPQFMAAGGETLPVAIRQVIFPMAYWDLIQKHAVGRGLDPHLMAALITQESTFQADVKSGANAWGLMQILPSTGRSYAAKVGVKPWRVSKLTNPDVNIRIGMAYFADLVKRYDGVVGALVAYNAGGSRYRRWVAEYPNADRDEFIDNIPFFETQNYLKRILGTADDFRALYPRQGAGRAGASGTR